MIRYIDENYAVAPQLRPEHMEQAAQLGFRTIINNRPDFEEGPHQPSSRDMEEAARAAGLHYAFVPVGGGLSADQQALKLKEVLADAPRPVLAYCRSGNRSSIVYMIAKAQGA